MTEDMHLQQAPIKQKFLPVFRFLERCYDSNLNYFTQVSRFQVSTTNDKK